MTVVFKGFCRRFAISFSLLLLFACSNPNPETVAEHYWGAILAGDNNKAESLSHRESQDGLELSELIQPGSNSQVAFGDSTLDSNQATIDTTVHWVDGDGETVDFEIATHAVLIDGTWKIDADQTALAFFDSVYQYSIDSFNSEDYFKDSRREEAEELEAMLQEFTEVQKELQQQQREGNQEVLEFLNQLDEELQEEIIKRN